MDLKSMLNTDGAAQRPPRLHTPQSSYDAHSAASYDSHTNRSSPYPPPLQHSDSRSQSGSYFGVQSPHQAQLNSASTSAGTHSVYAQSPGTHPHPYPPRDVAGPHHVYPGPPVAQSPVTTTSLYQPPTPAGSLHYTHHNHNHVHTPGSAHSQQGQHPPYTHSQSPRGSVPPSNHQQLQHQPVTPLGPPVAYNKASPQTQRPPSQGIEHSYRRSSYGSVGSAPGRDYNHAKSSSEVVRASSVQRQSHPDLEPVRERDRSVSVSPKTIPKPSPHRQSNATPISNIQSATVQLSGGIRHAPPPAAHSHERTMDTPHPTLIQQSSTQSAASDEHSRGPSVDRNMGSAVGNPPGIGSPVPKQQPHSSHVPITSLKRNASVMSDSPNAAQQPRKRLRRDEVPLFAQSSRKRPPRFGNGSRKARFISAAPVSVQPTEQRTTIDSPTNGHPPTDVAIAEAQVPVQHAAPGMKWEPTIANVVPEDDLCRGISRWIHSYIGNRVPPPGAVFEIEAKIGAIWDTQMGERIRLPVRSEAITAIGLPHVKFESSMDMEQHRQLNEYLNNLAQIAWNDPARESVRPRHIRQYDDFFELTPEGLTHLNPALMSGKARRPRVRRTTDKDTGKVLETIVKTRIDDLEVYNPVHDFDFRISISIESTWEGDPSWLIPTQNNSARTRLKDRMSYRHGAIQVDLTQVSHEDSPRMEHELEVEVSVAMLQVELEKERMGLPSRFHDLVKSLVDNARLLCRHGSLYRSAQQ